MGDPQGRNAAVQKDMTVRASQFLMSLLTKIPEPLPVYFHEDNHHYGMWRRGLDRHLSKPDRGSYRLRRQNPPQL